jgi:transposase
MLSFSSRQRYYLYTGPTDMRKQFDGLAGVVRREFSQEVMGGDVFIFINRRRDRIKLLKWDLTGFALYYKRLEAGTFERPLVRAGENSVELAWPELVLLLEGIELQSVKRRKRYRQRA